MTDHDTFTADDWNRLYPVGTPVRFWLLEPGNGRGVATKTRTPAWALGHGAVVVCIEGRSGGVAITHLAPIATAAHVACDRCSWTAPERVECETCHGVGVRRNRRLRRCTVCGGDGYHTGEQLLELHRAGHDMAAAGVSRG